MNVNEQNPEAANDPFLALVISHQSRLKGLIRCLIVGNSDVDDLVQEVNVVLWRKSDQFQLGTDFWAWASQIARFKVMERARKLSRDRLVFDEAFMEQLAVVAAERALGADHSDALRACLKQLPPAQRTLIEMRYSGDRSPQNIAEQLQRPVGSIRQTLYRVRGLLLECIERRIRNEEMGTQGIEALGDGN